MFDETVRIAYLSFPRKQIFGESMGIVITVDLGTSSPSDIARAAKFMLECAGYQDPSVAQVAHDDVQAVRKRASGASIPDSYTSRAGEQRAPVIQGMQAQLVGARGSLGEEISDDNGLLPVVPTIGSSNPGTHGEEEEGSLPAATVFAAGTPERAFAAALATTLHDTVLPPTVTLPPPPPGIEVDAQGVPWDQRIHAGSRAKIADGTWRQRRNLDPVVFKQVMDELRATMGVERRAPTPPAPPAPVEVFAPHPPVPPIPVAPPVPPVVISHPEVPPVPFAGSAVPPAPPTSGTPAVPASAGAATAASPGSAPLPTFPQLMQRITAAFTAKTLDQPTIIAAVQKVGLSSLPMLASRPDLVADVATELGIAL